MIYIFILEVLQIYRIDIWVLDEHHEVYLEVKLQLFVSEILLLDIRWDELIEGLEELSFVATIKALLNLLQHGLWRRLLPSLALGRLHPWFAPLSQALVLWRPFCHFLFQHLCDS